MRARVRRGRVRGRVRGSPNPTPNPNPNPKPNANLAPNHLRVVPVHVEQRVGGRGGESAARADADDAW